MYTIIDLIVWLATGVGFGLFVGFVLASLAWWRWLLKKIERLELL